MPSLLLINAWISRIKSIDQEILAEMLYHHHDVYFWALSRAFDLTILTREPPSTRNTTERLLYVYIILCTIPGILVCA